MSETLFHDRHTERALVNSPVVIDTQNTPVYPDLMDRGAMQQKAADWYSQADTLTSPDLDPEYDLKLKQMGPAPTDAYGYPVDKNGERLPDRNAGMSQQERINTMTSTSLSETADHNVQYAIDHHAKHNKARFRDNVMTDLMGDRMVKDPLSGIWRAKTEGERLYELGGSVNEPKGDPLLSEAEAKEQGWLDRYSWQVAGGSIDAMINAARTVDMASMYLTAEGNAFLEGRRDKVNSPTIDSYALYGQMGQQVKVESDGTISSGLVRGFSQFLVPFTAGMRATSAMSQGVGFIRPLAVGFATDLTASQASDGNLADLFLALGADNESLKFMSASKATSQLEGKLKIAVEGGIIGEGIGLFLKGGTWAVKKTKNKKALEKTAEFLMVAAKAARRTNTAQVELIEKDASEIIANHLLEQYDAQQLALPAPPERAALPAPEKAAEPAKTETEQEGKPEDKPAEAKPEQAPQPVYAPSPEVKEAYAQFALAKILKEDLSPDEWMKEMKGKGHPQLLQQSYDHAQKYINNDGRVQAYYHRTERAVIAVQDTKKGRTADQWLQEIQGAGQGKGTMGKLPADIRPNVADMKWLGIEDFLKERKGKKVTKDELIEHIRSNRVEIEDIDKGAGEGEADLESDEFLEALYDAEYERLPTRDNDGEVDEAAFDKEVQYWKDENVEENRDEWTDEFREELEDEYTDEHGEINEEGLNDAIEQAIDERAEEWARSTAEESAPMRVTFSDPDGEYEYTAVGQDDYGWTVTDPDGNQVSGYGMGDIYDIDAVDDLIREHARDYGNYDEALARQDAEEATGMSEGPRHEDYNLEGPYTDYSEVLLTMPKLKYGTVESSHFHEENVIVHTRINNRVDKSGSEVLFVEEVQSDYAKKGREKGFKGTKPTDKEVREHFELAEDVEDIEPYRQELMEKGQGVPDAPVKKTEQWAGMAMRRMIRYAVDHGQKKIAWTTGDMQAKLWGRKVEEAAKEVIWNPETGSLSVITPQDELKELATGLSKADLARHVGNDAAGRLNKAAAKTGEARLAGDDIIVGEGAKGYRTVYDAEIPKAVEKYVKQWKGKVTQTEINVGTAEEPEWEKVWAVEFPEEMVKSARGGVPLLQLTPGIMAPAAAGQLLEVEGENDSGL